jgi:hypothetical protein
VHLGTEDVHVELELLADVLDIFETFLVVGTSSADPDLNLVLIEEASDLTKGTNDAFEGRSNLEHNRVSAKPRDVLLEEGASLH